MEALTRIDKSRQQFWDKGCKLADEAAGAIQVHLRLARSIDNLEKGTCHVQCLLILGCHCDCWLQPAENFASVKHLLRYSYTTE